jgi:hypothetical protein
MLQLFNSFLKLVEQDDDRVKRKNNHHILSFEQRRT